MTAVADRPRIDHQVWDIRPPLVGDPPSRAGRGFLAGGRVVVTQPRPAFLDAAGLLDCPACEWAGVPTYIKGAAQSACPACEHDVAPKVGRNDPCSCGSGRKYKKCCGR